MIVIAKIIMIGLVTFGFHCNNNFRSIGGLLYVSDFKLMLKTLKVILHPEYTILKLRVKSNFSLETIGVSSFSLSDLSSPTCCRSYFGCFFFLFFYQETGPTGVFEHGAKSKERLDFIARKKIKNKIFK